MAKATMGTKFYYYLGEVPTLIYGMMTKPALPGLPNSIEATSQEDTVQKFTAGVRQVTDANFGFKYDFYDDKKTNFNLFMELQASTKGGARVKFGVYYPSSGTSVEFKARPYVQRDGTGVNALDTFTVAMLDIDELETSVTKAEGDIKAPVATTP